LFSKIARNLMFNENESQTRKDRIDKKLSGWTILRHHHKGMDTSVLDCHAVEEYPTENGEADYALFVNGKLLGIIEGKKVSIGAQNVLEQAKRYSRAASGGVGCWNGYRVPFLYSTNGENIYFLDVRDSKNISRKIAQFHTKEAMLEMLESEKDSAYSWMQGHPVQPDQLRYYQKDAILYIEEAIRKGHREMLIAMATGTGKTFMIVAEIYRLLESRLCKKILFLVDRRSLAAQAVQTLHSFTTPQGKKLNQEYEVYYQQFQKNDLEEQKSFDVQILPNSYLTQPNSSHTFVYVCTIQRMAINLFGKQIEYDEENADKLDIPIHAFDVIIADECHRGYTAKEDGLWRQVLEYFDAIKIGLTATPAPHSLSLFKNVVYRYATEKAVLDGYLVDYEAVKIKSNVRIHGAFLHPGEHVGVIDTITGQEVYDDLEEERAFSSDEIEMKITAPESNRQIIKEIAQYAYEWEKQNGHFPKTLIFAANDLQHISHADQLVHLCKEEFQRGDDFVCKITSNANVDRPLQKIREFRNRPNPSIVVSVDMLSTGVDIPCIEFIVFLRAVKSRILWVQMLGRGTRRCTEIHKTHYTIFDCFDGTLIEYFRNTTDFHVDLPSKDVIPIVKLIQNIAENKDREYNTKLLIKRLHRIENTMSGKAREQFSRYIPQGDMGRFARELPDRLKDNFIETMSLLQNKNFQELLLHYPKPKKDFLVGYEVEDQVTSEYIIGHLKPQDYLHTFSQFILEKQNEIEAVQVLLERPKEWNPGLLDDLQKKLEENKFPGHELQKAYSVVYKKSLADIISMIKHATHEESPIYNAQERVDRAMKKLMDNKSFSHEQQQWLSLIREHLVRNLTISLQDFDIMPIFESKGGLKKAEQVFDGQLEKLIEEINYLIAA